jgi:peptide chain release factor 1
MWPQNVTKSDLRIDYYRGSGKGGQKKNKTSSACRITHIPTGISAQCEDTRSQPQNQKLAFLRLADKLVPIMKNKAKPVLVKDTSRRVRTYHEPRNEVKDHTTGKTYSFDEFLNGKGLDKAIEACKREISDGKKL